MALDTYANLKAAIATRLHSTDLTAEIVDYITIAEKSLNHVLGLNAQELETTLTATVSSRSLTLPSGFGSPIGLYLTTYLPRIELVFKLPEEMQVYSDNGPAEFWTLDGTAIKTDTPADLAYTYTLRYKSEFDIASTSTNSLLTNYPDLYFYGALIEAADDLQDEKKLARYQQRYARALCECLHYEAAKRRLAKLRTEIAGTGGANIIRGF